MIYLPLLLVAALVGVGAVTHAALAALFKRLASPLVLILAVLAVGCVPVSAVHEDVTSLREAWTTWKNNSRPADGISQPAWDNMASSVDRNLTELETVTSE